MCIRDSVKDGGSWRTAFTLFDTTGYQTTVGSVSVPANANAIHVQYAVGGGGGGVGGAEYDKAGVESAGGGGSSGGYISDKVFSVTGGETLTVTAGAGGAGTGGGYNSTATTGGTTSITGSSSGSLFSLSGGGGSYASGGGDQGPPRNNYLGAVGTATISGTVLTTGTTVDGLNITTFNSGPVGTFNSIDPRVQDYVAKKLKLNSEDISTQVIPRDRHAYFFSVLGILASSIERFAVEIRNLQKTEVLEVEESFSSNQKGSSAMPHKRNPVLSENLTGISRYIRSGVIPSLENVVPVSYTHLTLPTKA